MQASATPVAAQFGRDAPPPPPRPTASSASARHWPPTTCASSPSTGSSSPLSDTTAATGPGRSRSGRRTLAAWIAGIRMYASDPVLRLMILACRRSAALRAASWSRATGTGCRSARWSVAARSCSAHWIWRCSSTRWRCRSCGCPASWSPWPGYPAPRLRPATRPRYRSKPATITVGAYSVLSPLFSRRHLAGHRRRRGAGIRHRHHPGPCRQRAGYCGTGLFLTVALRGRRGSGHCSQPHDNFIGRRPAVYPIPWVVADPKRPPVTVRPGHPRIPRAYALGAFGRPGSSVCWCFLDRPTFTGLSSSRITTSFTCKTFRLTWSGWGRTEQTRTCLRPGGPARLSIFTGSGSSQTHCRSELPGTTGLKRHCAFIPVSRPPGQRKLSTLLKPTLTCPTATWPFAVQQMTPTKDSTSAFREAATGSACPTSRPRRRSPKRAAPDTGPTSFIT